MNAKCVHCIARSLQFPPSSPAAPRRDTMPEYHLVYFNARLRAEPIRWMFQYAGKEFQDDRIEWEEWEDRREGECARCCSLFISVTSNCYFVNR